MAITNDITIEVKGFTSSGKTFCMLKIKELFEGLNFKVNIHPYSKDDFDSEEANIYINDNRITEVLIEKNTEIILSECNIKRSTVF